MDGKTPDYRTYHHNAVLQPHIQGRGTNPKMWKKERRYKVHKVIRALEGVASDIKFTSVATHDIFMLGPKNFERGNLLALDRAYIDCGKFEELTKRGIVYVTKMKSGLSYKVMSDEMFMDQTKGMAMRIQNVTFTKKEKMERSSYTMPSL